MGRKKLPYTILPPATKGGSYRYRLGSDPKRRKISTGKMTEREAYLFCEALLKVDERSQQMFKDFAKDFYIVGKCPHYAIKKRTDKPIDEQTLKEDRARLENYLIPAFGEISLQSLSVSHWDRWLDDIELGKVQTMGRNPHKLANGTINRIRHCLIQILDIAVRYKILEVNIARLTEGMSQNSYKARDPLSEEEINKLFPSSDEDLLAIWGSNERIALFGLLLTAGLRSGEVQALKWGKVRFKDSGIIIDEVVKFDGSIGLPKGMIPRVLVLPSRTMNQLAKWKAESAKKDDDNYVFYQADQVRHIRGDSILTIFKRVLAKNNIDPTKNLVVHSLRHTFTTKIAEYLPVNTVMSFTGHKSIKMVMRYTHPNLNNDLKNMKQKYNKTVATIWEREAKKPKSKKKKKIDTENIDDQRIEVVSLT